LSKYFAGGHNFHGKYEYVPVESMQKSSWRYWK
jgi:tripeptide aminopeptidase